jgi:hypothetical protein
MDTPTEAQMAEIVECMSDHPCSFLVVDTLHWILSSKSVNWRRVLKALKVLDFCICRGPELAEIWARKNSRLIENLKDFKLFDESGRDVGIQGIWLFFYSVLEPLIDRFVIIVRQSATSLYAFILDEDRVRLERDLARDRGVLVGAQSFAETPQDASRNLEYASGPAPKVISRLKGVQIPTSTIPNSLDIAAHTVPPMLRPSSTSTPMQEIRDHPRNYRVGTDTKVIHSRVYRSGRYAASKKLLKLPRQQIKLEKEREAEEERNVEGRTRKPAERRAQAASTASKSPFVPGEAIDTAIAQVETTLAEVNLRQTAAGITTNHGASPVPISTPNLTVGQLIARRLNSHFTGRNIGQSLYSDDEIHEISTLLKHDTSRWYKTPRTYVILRTIGSLDLLDQCIDVGFSDYWLPVTERNLPEFLRPSVRTAFVDAQTLVLSKCMDLEKGAEGQHCYFRKGETLPLETKSILGSGGYGQVDRVLSLISFKEYARKRVLRSAAFRGRRKEDVKHFIAEIEILKRLKHRHVVEFVGSYTDAKYIGLIMTPIADGDLTAYLRNVKPVQYPELRTFFGCLATGLEFLHQHNVRHKDIKPGNILVNSGKVLFTDFGLSLDFTDATGSTTMSMVNGMTPRYCAPEVANYEPRNTMSDIWCLGIVFLEMIVTLKGEKIQSMDDYFKTNGSGQTFIRFNTVLMPTFMHHLGTLGQDVDNKPLEWIAPMLLEDQKLRPTASALVNQITTSMTTGRVSGFCGICCILPEEEDFSDYTSDD